MELRKKKWVSFYDVNWQRITNNCHIFIHQFVPNFLGYVSAKYYLNWFTVAKVITNKKG